VNAIETIIDGHVVIPHQPDWSNLPEINRVWRSQVATAKGGAEDRSSARADYWKRIRYEVLPFNQPEKGLLELRIREALKWGRAAVPEPGRGYFFDASVTAGDSSIVLDTSDHELTVGRYILLSSRAPDLWEQCEVALVVEISGATITLGAPIEFDYGAGDNVWPLVLGRLNSEDIQAMAPHRSRHSIDLENDGRNDLLISSDDFSDYPLGLVGTLNAGSGWAGAWTIGTTV